MSYVKDTDRGWRDLKRKLAELADAEVVVGLIVGKAGADAEVLTAATANEFGTRHIPERSFLRSTFDENQARFTEAARRAVDRIISGGDQVQADLGRLGQFIQGQVQAKIRGNVPPPNAPATVRAKIPRSLKGARRKRAIAGNKTLIHTGRMLNAVTYVVRSRSSE